MGRRKWIKIYVDNWLRQTLREETASVRGIWADLLVMAGDSAFGDSGHIKCAEAVGYHDEQIAGILHIDLEEWRQAKKRLIKTERISVDDKNIIHITKWQEYQSEYDRQRKYRK